MEACSNEYANEILRIIGPDGYKSIQMLRAQTVLDEWLTDIEGEDADATDLRVNDSIAKFLDVDSIFYFVNIIRNNRDTPIRTALARKGARAKLAADPKQADKAIVRECWGDWKNEPARYKSKAAFARDMREKFPNLESQPVIEGWCRLWERKT